MKRRLLLLIILCTVLTVSSCSSRDEAEAARLNSMAMKWLPVNLDSAAMYAESAISSSPRRSSQVAVSSNILGDVAFLRMNYAKADEMYVSALQNSGNHVEWLVAEVGLMNICQRTSDNMAFYRHRDRALQELDGINSEMDNLSESDRKRFETASADLRIISAKHFFELQQQEQGLKEISKLSSGERLRSDTLRYLRWNALRGVGFVQQRNGPAAFPDRMRYLYDTYHTAEQCGYISQSGLALQYMARILTDATPESIAETSSWIISSINPKGLDRLSLVKELLLHALQHFQNYGSVYGVIETYTMLGSCAIKEGEYQHALEWLSDALSVLNRSREISHPGYDDIPMLDLFREDGVTVENIWVEQIPLAAVPEMMSRIREEISLAFAGLGNKAASDYNRNVYLELQKTIRLDKRYEVRKQLLRRMNSSLNIALVCVTVLSAILIVLVIMFGRAVRRRNRQYALNMQEIMRLCSRILSTQNADYETAKDSIRSLISAELPALAGVGSVDVRIAEDGTVRLESPDCDRNARTILDTVTPFAAAALQGAEISRELDDNRQIAVKEHYIRTLHTEENRRQNLLRRACHSVIAECTPLIDRMLEAAARLRPDDATISNQLEYISELSALTGRYNAVLTQWIRMCQGEVSLHIENFEIQTLLDIIRRSERNFAQKGLKLEVCESSSVVRADRILTLFMLNTLADNARKFTPPGGTVSVGVTEGDGWVELSVTDTGTGLSEEDLHLLRDTKVFDPARIGSDNDSQSSKGSGFGLMNCKGIIEKYRKSGDVFDCCRFDVESVKGKGSRFSFRLPAGIRRAVGILLMLLIPFHAAAGKEEIGDSLLNLAYQYSDSLYQANVSGNYAKSLEYARCAINALNLDHIKITGDTSCLMQLAGNGVPAEQQWLTDSIGTDYETVLWIRNEVAVTALAINDREIYKYNDDAYLSLFRRYYSDSEIEKDCIELQQSNSNIRIAIVLLLLLLAGFFLFRFMTRSRNSLRYRSDMQQILKLTGRISESMTNAIRNGEYDLQRLADSLMDSISPDLMSMLPVESVCILIGSDGQTACSTRPDTSERTLADMAAVCDRMNERIERNRSLALPLVFNSGDRQVRMGAIALSFNEMRDEVDTLNCELAARYIGSMLHNCVLRLSSVHRDLEHMREESERLLYEENRLHVQNMVMDNCLSTLKHETLSYPSRIGMMADNLIKEGARTESIADLREICAYYRDIYDILSRNVRRQLSDMLLKVGKTDLQEMLTSAAARFEKRASSAGLTIKIRTECEVPFCRSDGAMLSYLLDNLAEQALCHKSDGSITLSATADGDFVRISLRDSRPGVPCDNLEKMFSPLWQDNDLNGDNQRYVICRQIIREHDEAMGHPGCQINAESGHDGELVIWFTLPIN